MDSSLLQLNPQVLEARRLLAQQRARLQSHHRAGTPGIQVCAQWTEILDRLIEGFWSRFEQEAPEPYPMALVAHGGYGRREMAPYSDVDLMLLYDGPAQGGPGQLAGRLARALFDLGLQLGFSVRTPRDALALARQDATVFTSLADSRRVAGDGELVRRFHQRLVAMGRRAGRRLVEVIVQARQRERHQYGDTVYLLEPNVKRSPGGLRDLQLIRWLSLLLYGQDDWDRLAQMGLLLPADRDRVRGARDFLLRLRNEMHFHAGRSQDLLLRPEQIRVAQCFGYTGTAGVLPVEQLMREYFEHTGNVLELAEHLVATARQARWRRWFRPWFSHQVEGDFRVGPVHISATRRGLKKVTTDLAEVLRLMDLANLYNKRIEHGTWEAIRRAMTERPPQALSPEAAARFLSLLNQPTRLGDLLRRLHQLRALELIIPPMRHARCLMQLNEYHKYTVDEHCIRAVECATEFFDDPGPVGQAYRQIRNKRTLHLALLLHDLGKGYPGDHSEVGRELARQTARRLQLPEPEVETVALLVYRHLRMAHLALRHDLDDPATAVRLAAETGSPYVLQLLYVMTCADLAAVGPGVLNQWKVELLTELYFKARYHLTGDAADQYPRRVGNARQELLQCLGQDAQQDWMRRQVAAMPTGFLLTEPPQSLAQMLRALHHLPHNRALAWGRYLPDRQVVAYTVGTYEEIVPGVFHRLTGALTATGHQILSADIHTLPGGMVLDRFYVEDSTCSGEPPQERIRQVCAALTDAIQSPQDAPPKFPRRWTSTQRQRAVLLSDLPIRVQVDNTTSDRCTILSVFAYDCTGLLYTIARAIFQRGLSVQVARIGTYLDQVVDVFYVVDQRGQKVLDPRRLDEVRDKILQAIDQLYQQQQIPLRCRGETAAGC